MPKTPGVTAPTQMRLRPETLADIDAIAVHLAGTTGRKASRSDAVRYAARQIAAGLPTAAGKKSKKSSQSG